MAAMTTAKTTWLSLAATAVLVFSASVQAGNTDYAIHGPPTNGTIVDITPSSSIERPGDAGQRMHTHYRVGVPAQRIDGPGHDAPPGSKR